MGGAGAAAAPPCEERGDDGEAMLSPLQVRKMTRTFVLADINRNGVVDRDDVATLEALLVAAYGIEHHPAARAQLKELVEITWEQLHRTAGIKAGTPITLDIWLAMCERTLASPANVRQAVEKGLSVFYALHAAVQPDEDAELTSRSHFQAFHRGFGVAEQDSAHWFDLLDANGDGFLTRADATRALLEFCGDEPAAIGNWFFGPY